MARPKSVDRELVLDAAESLVTSQGAAALTIGSVAKAAGISKGGVQSSFGNKEALLAAMLKRWMDAYEQRTATFGEMLDTPAGRIAAHVKLTEREDESSQTRAAGLLAALLQYPEQLADTRKWYQHRVEGLNGNDSDTRRARTAFLATEGAFFLRFLGLLPMTQSEWEDIFADIMTVLADG